MDELALDDSDAGKHAMSVAISLGFSRLTEYRAVLKVLWKGKRAVE